MTETQIELLTSKIQERIPKSLKLIDFLMDALDIGRESVYRRMRGEIPFTFEEIGILSLRLGFSVDEIIGCDTNNRIIISLSTNSDSDHDESFLDTLKEYTRYTEVISSSEEVEVLAAINRLSLFLIIGYDNLFKFFYYHWIHQTYSVSFNESFKDTVIPSDIQEMRQQFIESKNQLKNVSFIVDREIMLNVVRKIQYYYSRRLITPEEIVIIKDELDLFLKNLKTVLQTGQNSTGHAYSFYLSLLDIDTNNNCAVFGDGNIASLYWLFPTKPIVIINQEICQMQKHWLESFKKYSILITQSNELLQESFLEKQQSFIDSINNELPYF